MVDMAAVDAAAVNTAASAAHQVLDERNGHHCHSFTQAVRAAGSAGYISKNMTKQLDRLSKAADALRHITKIGLAGVLSNLRLEVCPAESGGLSASDRSAGSAVAPSFAGGSHTEAASTSGSVSGTSAASPCTADTAAASAPTASSTGSPPPSSSHEVATQSPLQVPPGVADSLPPLDGPSASPMASPACAWVFVAAVPVLSDSVAAAAAQATAAGVLRHLTASISPAAAGVAADASDRGLQPHTETKGVSGEAGTQTDSDLQDILSEVDSNLLNDADGGGPLLHDAAGVDAHLELLSSGVHGLAKGCLAPEGRPSVGEMVARLEPCKSLKPVFMVSVGTSTGDDTANGGTRWGELVLRVLLAEQHVRQDAIREDLVVARADACLDEFVSEGAAWVPLDVLTVLAVVRTTTAINSDEVDGFSTTIPAGTIGCVGWFSDELMEIVFLGHAESLLVHRAHCCSLEKEAG
jgi:hypothetical protein